MASAALVAKWPHAVPEHGETYEIPLLKFTGKVVEEPLILRDNARYEGTAGEPSFWVLKRCGESG
jgi:hypothetical protein